MKRLRIISDKKLEEIIQSRLAEYSREIDRQYEPELLKQQIELATLQAQINPHFLYNTLECIRGEAIRHGVNEISEITLALSRFYRYSINSKKDIVTLKDEIENVVTYMKIQQYRFKERFTLNIQWDETSAQLLNATIPKLSLQPIIENAINHGFKQKNRDARIDIEIVEAKRHINISISDNGAGMDKETLAKIQSGKSVGARERGSGIAVSNVNDRLKLLFGDEYGLTIESVEGTGTDVYIHIPKRLEKSNESGDSSNPSIVLE